VVQTGPLVAFLAALLAVTVALQHDLRFTFPTGFVHLDFSFFSLRRGDYGLAAPEPRLTLFLGEVRAMCFRGMCGSFPGSRGSLLVSALPSAFLGFLAAIGEFIDHLGCPPF
jgi:hypothetical protein